MSVAATPSTVTALEAPPPVHVNVPAYFTTWEGVIPADNLASVTFPFLILAVSTASVANLAAVTFPSLILVVVTAFAASAASATQPSLATNETPFTLTPPQSITCFV